MKISIYYRRPCQIQKNSNGYEGISVYTASARKDRKDVMACGEYKLSSLSHRQVGDTQEDKISEDSSVEKISESSGVIKENIESKPEPDKVDEKLHFRESFYSSWRNFNLDLAPKVRSHFIFYRQTILMAKCCLSYL